MIRDEAFDAMKDVYIWKMGQNLPVYAVPTKSMNVKLQAFCQTERDHRKGKLRMPSERYLLLSEEISEQNQDAKAKA